MNTLNSLPPLCFAALKGDLLSTQSLLKSGANPNEISSRGNSAITIAMERGHFEIVKALINTEGFEFFNYDKNHRMIFFVICEFNNDLFELALINCIKTNPQKVIENISNLMPAICYQNNLKALTLLLSCNLVPESAKQFNQSTVQNLMKNATNESFELLMKSLKDPNILMGNHYKLAAKRGLIEYFHRFPVKVSQYEDVLTVSLRFRHQNIVEYLLKQNPVAFHENIVVSLLHVCKTAMETNWQFLFNCAKKFCPQEALAFGQLGRKSIILKLQKEFELVFNHLKITLNQKDFKAFIENSILDASKVNNLETLNFLLSNSKGNLKVLLKKISNFGNVEAMKLILFEIKKEITEPEQIAMISEAKKLEIIKLLIETFGWKENCYDEFVAQAAQNCKRENLIELFFEIFPLSVFNSSTTLLLHTAAYRNAIEFIAKAKETLNSKLFYEKFFLEKEPTFGKTPMEILLRSVAFNSNLARNRKYKNFLREIAGSIGKNELETALETAIERKNKRAVYLFRQINPK